MFHMSVRVCFVSWIEYVSYVGESMFCIVDIYKFSITFSFSCIGQDKSKLQKKISKLFILTEMAA